MAKVTGDATFLKTSSITSLQFLKLCKVSFSPCWLFGKVCCLKLVILHAYYTQPAIFLICLNLCRSQKNFYDAFKLFIFRNLVLVIN